MLALSMQATWYKYANNTHFETDAGNSIEVDKRCSGCISNVMDDLIGPLDECN